MTINTYLLQFWWNNNKKNKKIEFFLETSQAWLLFYQCCSSLWTHYYIYLSVTKAHTTHTNTKRLICLSSNHELVICIKYMKHSYPTLIFNFIGKHFMPTYCRKKNWVAHAWQHSMISVEYAWKNNNLKIHTKRKGRERRH